MEDFKKYCYKDLQGNAYSILHLLLAGQKSDHVKDFFNKISEDEFNSRHFINIDWKSIANIANSCVSRQETYKYLRQIKN